MKTQIPVLILIDGVPGAGRGKVINLLNEWMDSRHLENHTFWNPSDETMERPEYWRYWMALPERGKIALFFGGWYSQAVQKAIGGKAKGMKFESALADAVKLEQMLAADGMLIIKLFLYLPKDKYLKRIKKTGVDPLSCDEDISESDYDNLLKYYGKAIRMTDTSMAHWYIINSASEKQRNITVLELLINNLNNALNTRNNNVEHASSLPITNPLPMHVLDKVDLSVTIKPKEYTDMLKYYQEKLNGLTLKAFSKGISTVVLFEGWDAAGKGGSIRRLSSAIDSRIRKIIPIGAPTDEEKAHHYLWRFWRYIPRAGYITIYDRSWYGRVLVERVEKFATSAEWSRAYEEINTFESQLVASGTLLIKFWLQISPDEQLKRFQEREELKWKNYKITPDDWRNREKAPAYNDAIDDMMVRTSTDIAPWTIIPANDKHYARVEVLKTVYEKLKKRL